MQNQNQEQQRQTAGRDQRGTAETGAKLVEKAEKAAEEVKTSAIEKVHSAREQARSGIDDQRTHVADRIRKVSTALRSTGDELRTDDEFVARYVDMAGDGIERVAAYVSSADLRGLARDVEQLARRRPAWFFGGAFLVGLAAGRFLKASSDSEPMELDALDLEDLEPPRRRYAGQQPITPQPTVPVTQGTHYGSGTLPGAAHAAGTPRTASPGSTTPGYTRPAETAGSGIFDPSIPGSPSGSKTP